ncbi:MAG: LLM class flavin-dependent oxidoreductase [Chloroflexi bacterium]|nr:LLM class flavin-dependent oxidoreductase [Chloroflexota bacterium]
MPLHRCVLDHAAWFHLAYLAVDARKLIPFACPATAHVPQERTVKYDVEFNSGAFYPAAATVQLAEIAEAKGFDAVWKGESNSTDPIVLLSAMAARTKTIQLGTAIYHIFGRSPVTLGIQAATLNDLSSGRVLLGLGVANKTIAAWHDGTFDRPLRRIREYAEIVRKTARGEKFEYEGEIHTVGTFRLSWTPSYPDVPIFFAGLGEQMTRLAGRYADGVVVNMANPPMIREIVNRVRQGAIDAGRDPSTLQYIIKARACVNPDREKARAKLRQVLTFYNLADHYSDMIIQMGFAEENRRVRDAYKEGGFRAAQAAVSDTLLENLPTIAATSSEEVRDRLQPYLEAGATRLIIPYVPVSDDATGETTAFLNAWRD